MNTPIKTRDDISIRTMLEECATCLTKNGKKYYFLPFYFMDDDTGEFEMLQLDDLPEELIKAIKTMRCELSNEDTTLIEYNNAISMKPFEELTPREQRERNKIVSQVKNMLKI
jgi:hypothetical protein